MTERSKSWRAVAGLLAITALAAGDVRAQLTIGSVAGRGIGDGRAATAASLDQPTGIYADADGALLIADSSHHRVRRVDPSGTISTMVGTIQGTLGDTFPPFGAQLRTPTRLQRHAPTFDLLIVERLSNRIRRVRSADNRVDTFAGTGIAGYSGDNGPANAAQLNQPNDIAEDSLGNVYIADYFNHVIRRVDIATGLISTVVGTGAPGYAGENVPIAGAPLNFPACILITQPGDVMYVCDKGNHVIRRIANGTMASVAGVPGTPGYNGDGPALLRRLNLPEDLAEGPGGSVLIADEGNQRIRQLDAGGNLVTLAGNGTASFTPDGAPAAGSALNVPFGVAFVGGRVVFAERESHRIRAIQGGQLVTLAGDGAARFGGDGGAAGDATFREPKGMALDAGGNLFIADSVNNRVRRVEAGTGFVSTVAGNGTPDFGVDGVPATVVGLNAPSDVLVDGAGRLIISDTGHHRIRVVDAEGIIGTLMGTGEAGGGGDGGPSAAAQLAQPTGLTLDREGNVVVADFGNNRIRRIRADGVVETLAGTGEAGFNGDGIPATQATLSNPTDMVFDGAGNLYVADFRNQRVRRVDAATGVITTVAGTGQDLSSNDNQPAVLASLNSPTDVAVDGNGNLYIVDSGSNRIRRVSNRGVIDTVAGERTPGDSGDGGPALAARLLDPLRLVLTPNRLYLADHGNGRIRALDGDLPVPAGGSGPGGGGPGGGGPGGGGGDDGCRGSLGRCIGGGGPKKTDCLLMFEADVAPAGGRVSCRDGDPACDGDSTQGQCTIRLTPCVNVNDSRNARCTTKAVTGARVRKPAGAGGQALLDALSGVGTSQVAAPSVTFAGGVSATACGQAATFVVPLKRGTKKGKLLVAAEVQTAERRVKDKDKVVVVCQPGA